MKLKQHELQAVAKRYGVLVISHGSRSEAWVRLVEEAVASVRVPDGVPVFCAYLELVAGKLIQDGIAELERQGIKDIAVVPLFISSGSTHLDEIRYALGLQAEPTLPTDLALYDVQARLHWGWPIDDDPDIGSLLYANIRELSSDPAREVVLVIGHGSKEAGFHERWRRGLELLAGRVQALGGFSGADAAMLLPDEAKRRLDDWNAKRPDCTVIVAPLFLSEGYFTKEVIPSRLKGSAYRYNGKALLPGSHVSRWMEKQIALLLKAAGAHEERTGD